MRIAAVGDIHVRKTSRGALDSLFRAMSERADVALLCGDLTDYGLPEEAELFAQEVRTSLRIPALAVLGNHDFESGQADEVKAIIASAGVVFLDGDSHEIDDVGFGGAKGFLGGFGRRQLGNWGEQSVKALVHEAVEEALKLSPPPKVIWMQLGARDDAAAEKAEAAGLKVVMNRCPKIEYGRLSSEISWMGVNSRTLSSKRAPMPTQGMRLSLNRMSVGGGATSASDRAAKNKNDPA